MLLFFRGDQNQRRNKKQTRTIRVCFWRRGVCVCVRECLSVLFMLLLLLLILLKPSLHCSVERKSCPQWYRYAHRFLYSIWVQHTCVFCVYYMTTEHVLYMYTVIATYNVLFIIFFTGFNKLHLKRKEKEKEERGIRNEHTHTHTHTYTHIYIPFLRFRFVWMFNIHLHSLTHKHTSARAHTVSI